jgi:peptidoglycan hydrolase-like protein with peptidoglycan-binding domain
MDAPDAAAFVVGTVAVIAILVNGLFMQSGLHPAPLYKLPSSEAKPPRPVPKAAAGAAPQRGESVLAPVTPKSLVPHARTLGEIIKDIQGELAQRGYYDGPVDGLYGPRTDNAILDFERAANLQPSAQPSEALLQAIIRSPVRRENISPAKPAIAGASRASIVPPAPPHRHGSGPYNAH